jgi:pyridoxamine 5'-phosphate oxidase
MGKKFETEELVKPPFWGGWRVVPHSIEFWVEGEFRIHKRVKF